MTAEQEASDVVALLKVVHSAAAQVGHAALAARAGDSPRAHAHAVNALRFLNTISDELRWGAALSAFERAC